MTLFLLTMVSTVVSGGEVATSYTDDTPYTPTWQEKITGVKQILPLPQLVNLQTMQKN